MGNDGGSIPDRRDLVRNKPKARPALSFSNRNGSNTVLDRLNKPTRLTKLERGGSFALYLRWAATIYGEFAIHSEDSVNYKNRSSLVPWGSCTTKIRS